MSPAPTPAVDLLPLIRTKLAPPRVASAPVERVALLQELEARRERKLSIVMGPAGSGKTSVLTQWRKTLLQRGAAVAWYNVGADDDDVHVATYIIEALRQAGAPIASDGLKLFVRSGGRAWQHLLATLINDLDGDPGAGGSGSPGEIYLVMDDFHHLGSFPMLQLIDRWLALAPAGFHLVIGTRARPPLDLPRLSAEDQLTEIRFERLRFDIDETRRFVEARGLKLSNTRIDNLQKTTDGWAAGLQLLTFSLRNDARSEGFLERIDNLSLLREEALARYLETAAIHHLSDAELNFLTRVSACRRFNRELCQLLTGDPDAAAYLQRFEAENLFLLPIDTTDAEPWYRFHRLFANFLNKRLERLDKVELHKLHRLASHWFAGRNMHVEALRHADLGRDVDFMIELIDRAGRRMTNGAQYLEFLEWYGKVPAEQLTGRINILMCAALAQVSCSRLDQLEHTLASIEAHPAYARAEIRAELQLFKAYRHMRLDDTAAQMRAVEEVQREPVTLTPLQTWLMKSITGFALIYAKRYDEARELVRSRYRHGDSSRRSQSVPFVDMVSGVSFLVQGNFHRAIDQLLPVLEAGMRLNALDTDAAGVMVGYLVEIQYQLGRLDETRRLLELHQELIDAVSLPDGVLMSHRVRARIERIDKDDASALQSLRHLEESGYRMGLKRLVAWSLHDQLQIALERHESAQQRELLQRLTALAKLHPPSNGVQDEIGLAAALAHADWAFSQSDDRSALLAIGNAAAIAESSGRQLAQTRLGLLRAMVLLRSGQDSDAINAAMQALDLALEFGMMRVVADLGPAVLPLTAALLAASGNEAHKAFLLQSRRLIEGHGEPPPEPAAASSGDAAATRLLSIREREVLELLSRALSAKTIARQLSVSPGTVKWHLRNIYSKLGAATREDALARARALHILR